MDDVIAVVTDLFFQSRISAAARAAARRVRYVTASTALLSPARLCLVDLEARTDVLTLIRRLKGEARAPVVAFGPHIDVAGRKAARSAGADRVLAKSKFVTELPRLMNESPPGSESR